MNQAAFWSKWAPHLQTSAVKELLVDVRKVLHGLNEEIEDLENQRDDCEGEKEGGW